MTNSSIQIFQFTEFNKLDRVISAVVMFIMLINLIAAKKMDLLL